MKQYIREKSEWQKDDCLVCYNESKFEIVFKESIVRFCGDLECLARIMKIVEKVEKNEDGK